MWIEFIKILQIDKIQQIPSRKLYDTFSMTLIKILWILLMRLHRCLGRLFNAVSNCEWHRKYLVLLLLFAIYYALNGLSSSQTTWIVLAMKAWQGKIYFPVDEIDFSQRRRRIKFKFSSSTKCSIHHFSRQPTHNLLIEMTKLCRLVFAAFYYRQSYKHSNDNETEIQI